MSDKLEIVTTVNSEAEAELVRERLLAADIHAISQRTIGGPEWGYSGARDVFVSARDLDRAHEVLKADEGSFSDEELGRVSEEAGKSLTGDEQAPAIRLPWHLAVNWKVAKCGESRSAARQGDPASPW